MNKNIQTNSAAPESTAPFHNLYRRNLGILLLTAFILFLIFIFGNLIQSRQRHIDLGGTDQFFSEDIDIQRITIRTEKDIALRLTEGMWTVQSFGQSSGQSSDARIRRARAERVEDFTDALLTAQFIRRASNSLEDADSFGLNNSETVELFDGEERLIGRFYFGNIAAQRSEQYFRIEDMPEIYTIDTSLSFYLNQPELYWTDLRLWEEVDDLPLSFYRTYPNGIRENWFKDEDDQWVSSVGDDVLPEVDNAARTLLRLEGENIVDALPDEAEYILGVGVETDASRDLSIIIYKEQHEESITYYMSQSADSALKSPEGGLRIYVLPEWRYTIFSDF